MTAHRKLDHMSELFDLAFARLDRAESRRTEFCGVLGVLPRRAPVGCRTGHGFDDTFETIVKAHEPDSTNLGR